MTFLQSETVKAVDKGRRKGSIKGQPEHASQHVLTMKGEGLIKATPKARLTLLVV